MTDKEKIQYLSRFARIAFCEICDEPIHLDDNTPFYSDPSTGNYTLSKMCKQRELI